METSRHCRCQLCGRRLRCGTTQHHLIPRRLHSNKWFKARFTREQLRRTVELCPECHRAIHRLIPSEKEMGRQFRSLETLRAHPEVARFVSWVRKQR